MGTLSGARMASIRRRRGIDWFWAGAAAVALALFLWFLSSTIADLAAFRARAWVDTWSNLARQAAQKSRLYEPKSGDWQAAHRDAMWAVRLSPFNADYRQVLADVYASRDLGMVDGDPRLLPMLERAEYEYRRSITLRPVWPYGYLGLAYVLRRANRLDAQYEQALRDALHYGPWEPMILATVVDLNLDVLSKLRPSTRQLVLDALVRGQAWTADSQGRRLPYGDQIWGRVTSRHRELAVCGWLRLDTPLLRQRCTPSVSN